MGVIPNTSLWQSLGCLANPNINVRERLKGLQNSVLFNKAHHWDLFQVNLFNVHEKTAFINFIEAGLDAIVSGNINDPSDATKILLLPVALNLFEATNSHDAKSYHIVRKIS